jgi:hypothetical protein
VKPRLPIWWRTHFLILDLVAALAAVALLLVWLERYGGEAAIAPYLNDERGSLYTSAAAIYGALLGFLIASISIVITAVQAPRFDPIRNSESYADLWKAFFSAIRLFGLGTVLAIACLLVDTDKHPNAHAFELLAAVSVIAVVRLSRSVNLLRVVVAAA